MRKCSILNCMSLSVIKCSCKLPPGYFCQAHIQNHVLSGPTSHIIEQMKNQVRDQIRFQVLEGINRLLKETIAYKEEITKKAFEIIKLIQEMHKEAQNSLTYLDSFLTKQHSRIMKSENIQEVGYFDRILTEKCALEEEIKSWVLPGAFKKFNKEKIIYYGQNFEKIVGEFDNLYAKFENNLQEKAIKKKNIQSITLRILNLDNPPDFYCKDKIMKMEKDLNFFLLDDISADEIRGVKKSPVLISDSIIYTGEWDENKQRSGRGIQVEKNVKKIIGHFKEDKAWGKGQIIYNNGGVYVGNLENGKEEGIGSFYSIDNSYYFGSWHDSKKHGKGIEQWADGSSYEGEFFMGLKNGEGKFFFGDGSVYTGSWRNDKFSGFGVYEWSNGKVYKGEWEEGCLNGRGFLLMTDGCTYDGDFVNDVKHGYGVLTWPDGRKYSGQWVEGIKEGKGIYIDVRGKQKEGVWKNNKRLP